MTNPQEVPPQAGRISRRRFLSASGAAVAGAGLTARAAAMPVHDGGSDVIRVGLIGCGGRGTGAASNALAADKGVELVAMGDLFADRLESSLSSLQHSEHKDRVKVDADHRFVGWDNYRRLLTKRARAGVLTLNAITQDSSANATGTATWFRIVKSDGTTHVLDGSVGTSGSDLNLTTTSIVATQPVSVTSFTITEGNP